MGVCRLYGLGRPGRSRAHVQGCPICNILAQNSSCDEQTGRGPHAGQRTVN